MSINWWMDKEDKDNGILFSHEKEWNYAICNNVDGAYEYNTKWNKSVRERKYHMISLIYGI